MTTISLNVHIEMLLNDYNQLREETLTLSSISSGIPFILLLSNLLIETLAQHTVRQSSKKLALPPQRTTGKLPACRGLGCGSLDVIEDVSGGSVVCTQCGLIQATSVFENASTSAIYHEGVSRIVVHHYSRLPYLRSCLKSLQGETHIELLPRQAELLLEFFQNAAPPPTGHQVKKAISSLHLPRKLLYHAHSIAFMLFQSPTPNPSEQEIRDVCRLFRVLESAWDRLPLGGSIRNGRKKFLSYPLVWALLCQQLGFLELANIFPPLKNPRLVKKQCDIFDKIVDFIDA
jgi:hypothetical protein